MMRNKVDASTARVIARRLTLDEALRAGAGAWSKAPKGRGWPSGRVGPSCLELPGHDGTHECCGCGANTDLVDVCCSEANYEQSCTFRGARCVDCCTCPGAERRREREHMAEMQERAARSLRMTVWGCAQRAWM